MKKNNEIEEKMDNKKEDYYVEKAAQILRKVRVEGKKITEKDTKELVDLIRYNHDRRYAFVPHICLSTSNELYILKVLLFHGILLEPIHAARRIRNLWKDGYITEKKIQDIYQGEKKYNTTDFCSGILLQEIMKE